MKLVTLQYGCMNIFYGPDLCFDQTQSNKYKNPPERLIN